MTILSTYIIQAISETLLNETKMQTAFNTNHFLWNYMSTSNVVMSAEMLQSVNGGTYYTLLPYYTEFHNHLATPPQSALPTCGWWSPSSDWGGIVILRICSICI